MLYLLVVEEQKTRGGGAGSVWDERERSSRHSASDTQSPIQSGALVELKAKA